MPILTIVFTDVVRSSEIKRDPSFGRDSAERDSAYLAGVQVPHYNLVRECYKEHGGQEVNTMGDAFYLLFPDPVEAVRCSVDIQEQLSNNPIQTPRGPLRLRIGIHTGAPQPFDNDWHGTDVDIAARVEAMATGGQILLSPTTYELVRHMTDIKFYRMGEFMLKEIDRVVLWEADWDGNGPRPTERPPLSLDLYLPPSIRGFVGRSTELAELESLVEKCSAVNIEGLSGIGKTSLTLNLSDKWLKIGRLAPNGLFYFDCSQRNMRLGVAAEFVLRNLAAFFSQVGASEAAAIVSNEQQPLDHRYNAISGTFTRGSFLIFLDNFQDALDDKRRIASQPLADLLYFLLSRPLGDSRFICASYVQCSWSSRLSIQPFRLKPLSSNDARTLLISLGINNLELADRAAQLVGRHPQAIRWFSVLPRELGLSVEEVINDLTDDIHDDATGSEFHRRIEDELLRRIWDTLSREAGHFLSISTVFRRPVPFRALCTLTTSPEVNQWRQILLDRFLLDATTREGPHSLHAIVREFATERIESGSDDWRNAHRAAAEWWQGQAGALMHATREELEAAIEAHYHLVSAGDIDEADTLAIRLRPILRAAGLQSYRQGMMQENEAINRALVQMAPNDHRSHLYLANTLSHRGKKYREEAEWHFKRALEISSKFNAARNQYAQFLAGQGRNEEAEAQLQQSINDDPQGGRNHVSYAAFLAKNKRFEEAEEQFQIGIKLEPEDATLRNIYASFLGNRGLSTEAENQFQVALKAQPENVVVLESYAAFLMNHNRYIEAEIPLRTAIDIDPNNIRLRKAYIRFLSIDKRTKEVDAQLKAIISLGLDNASVRTGYLRTLAKYAPPEEVNKKFKAAIEGGPQREYIRKMYIKYLIVNGRTHDAEEQFKVGINTAPDNASLRRVYGTFLYRSGRSKEAEEQFKAGMNAQTEDVSIRRSYIKFLAIQRRFDEADAQFQAILQFRPMSATLQQLTTFVNRQRKVLQRHLSESDSKELMTIDRYNMWNMELSVDERITSCRAILEQNQDDFQANYCLGRTLLEQLKDATSAEPYLRRARELQPDDPIARLYYGQVLEKLCRFDEALAELDAVANTLANNAELHNSRANCLKQVKHWSEAEIAYREAIHTSSSPRTAKYLNNLALLFCVWPDTTRINEGLQLCDQVAQQYPKFPWTQKTRSELEGRINQGAQD